MTINEAVKAQIFRLTRADWAWNSWVDLYPVVGQELTVGSWAKVVTLPLEPEQVLVFSLPSSGWIVWSVPESRQEFYQSNTPVWLQQSAWNQP